jgi:K(+)-stimulated pyrophosphate-energized sodium pump
MDYAEKPEYGRVVDICKDSLRVLTPGLLAVLTPIAVGFAFRLRAARLVSKRDRGQRADGGLLANSGGAGTTRRSSSGTAATAARARTHGA